MNTDKIDVLCNQIIDVALVVKEAKEVYEQAQAVTPGMVIQL